MAEEKADIFLSCFKCGRIVRAGDPECPRCGLQFGPGTLFECPFCSGLVWRNASKCSTCGIDLTEFSISVEKTFAGFDMDEFVENIINTELEQLRSAERKVACPGCGLMIRGDEEKCPRCDLPLGEASVECPVCGEKMPIRSASCPNCRAEFAEREAASEATGPFDRAPKKTGKPARKPARPKGGPKPKSARKSPTKKKPVKKGPAKRKPAKKKPAKKKPASKKGRQSGASGKKKSPGRPKKK